MENASKALLIAGGILLAMILLCAVILNYNKIVDFYNKDKNMTKAEQIAKFNNEYTGYNREDVRGSELLSLVNKVIDNNERNSEEKININIKIDNSKIKEFYYDKDTNYGETQRISTSYTQDNEYHILSDAVNGSTGIINTYKNKLNGLNEKKLQTLAKGISNLFAYDDDNSEYNKKKRDDIVKELFGNSDNDTVQAAKKAALEYYQIQQFKRAHFECKSIDYDDTTGKIKSFEFEFAGDFN